LMLLEAHAVKADKLILELAKRRAEGRLLPVSPAQAPAFFSAEGRLKSKQLWTLVSALLSHDKKALGGVQDMLLPWAFKLFSTQPKLAAASLHSRLKAAADFQGYPEPYNDWPPLAAMVALMPTFGTPALRERLEARLQLALDSGSMSLELFDRLAPVFGFRSYRQRATDLTDLLAEASTPGAQKQAAADLSAFIQSIAAVNGTAAGSIAQEALSHLYERDLATRPELGTWVKADRPEQEKTEGIFTGRKEVRIGDVPLLVNRDPRKDEGAVPTKAEADLVLTPTTWASLEKLAVLWASNSSATLEGPTSSGKTALLTYLAYLTQTPVRRINLSEGTEVPDLLGHWVGKEKSFTAESLARKTDDQLFVIGSDYLYEGTFDRDAIVQHVLEMQEHPRWVDGDLVKAMKRGELVILDEVNLAPPEVLERLNSAFDDDGNIVLAEHDNEVVNRHENFRIYATMNPSSYGDRNQLNASFRSRLPPIWMKGLEAADVRMVLQERYQGRLPPAITATLTDAHMALSRVADTETVGATFGGLSFTLRNAMRVAERFERFRGKGLSDEALLRRELEEVYLGGLSPAEKERLRRAVLDPIAPWPNGKPPQQPPLALEKTAKGYRLGDLDIVSTGLTKGVPDDSAQLALTQGALTNLYRVAKAFEMGENPYLAGDAATGKSALVKWYAHLKGLPYYRQNFQRDTDTADILGMYQLDGWHDGLLPTAMKNNGLYVMDEPNVARGGTLERTNSMLERGRSIRFEGHQVHAEPDFRVAATSNPASEEYRGTNRFSKAFMNRFTLIDVEAPGLKDQETILRFKAKKLRMSDEDASRVVPALVELHQWVREGYENGDLGPRLARRDRPPLDLRALQETLKAVIKLQEKGLTLKAAYLDSVKAHYMPGRFEEDDKAVWQKANELGRAHAGSVPAKEAA
jgi:MoxR-like ATPase